MTKGTLTPSAAPPQGSGSGRAPPSLYPTPANRMIKLPGGTYRKRWTQQALRTEQRTSASHLLGIGFADTQDEKIYLGIGFADTQDEKIYLGIGFADTQDERIYLGMACGPTRDEKIYTR